MSHIQLAGDRWLTILEVREDQMGSLVMRKLIITISLLGVLDSSMALAQPRVSRNEPPPPSMNLDQRPLPEAPVGHRQPRADQVPPEKDLMNPNDPFNRENATLDRLINGICRGC